MGRIPESIFKGVLAGQPSAVTRSIGNGVCPLHRKTYHTPVKFTLAHMTRGLAWRI